MRPLHLAKPGERLSVLCLGAHSDDIEIGAGATLLSLIERGVQLDVHWCVLSGGGVRDDEAKRSAADFLADAATAQVEVTAFRDGFFPEQGEAIKQWFEALKQRVEPDLILTHRRDDAHQDHRQVCRLTWNTFRDHQILEYEIPKWDGDIGQPNVYVPVSAQALQRKIELLIAHFGSQRSKQWFDEETFRGLARIRGMECRAPERYAEAFFGRKLSLL
ncbi:MULTISPECIES: PIG-L deacetylase family protein [Rhodopseudomonas]|uniref:GlcNAc-PI de-N-acetylase n=1 Tax=Rhodopseudomonas palustris TaxID=1076 RepID=A0A0D7F3C8_RHOPL|nr:MULTISPECIES: PIG-L deacetylase family protein [Rhodopseudomonas]KIZ47613.1 GlcNAc-PI de-N-acetylase [Rhodopseudomonas palustris]MDF3810633.1 PIG-L family deacetylase [Rhodopseudomonas sp. BAL398]WOK15844.1 PIG-L deacetylase family protein [Rhodopseudomonas sp. BAL398]